jgi:acyl-CoA dehydrogenase
VDFDLSPKVERLRRELSEFMTEHIYPNEAVYHEQLEAGTDRWVEPPIVDDLRAKARRAGLWNLFLPESDRGAGLTNLEYAPLCELMGRSHFAPDVFNCNPPDTGNMEVLDRYGTEAQKQRWLVPLLAGQIGSAFAMTEPGVASSDATNIESSITLDGDHYRLNGHKWFATAAGSRRCRIMIFMGKTDPTAPRHQQQSMILVEPDTPGVEMVRPITVFGYDAAPVGHWEIRFNDVRVPTENLLLGEGRGFDIAQGRLGPGRIHHCMRLIGLAERCLEAMCDRAKGRVAFGGAIADKGVVREAIAESRIDIEQARLLTLKAAHMMDTVGNKAARAEIAMIKVVAPNVAQRVIDRAIQVHGAAGVADEYGLAYAWVRSRELRIADGPDAVHRETVAKLELRKEPGGPGSGGI